MPANKYALLRYRIIDKCIRNKYHPYPSKQDLREACEEALYGIGSGRISDSTIEKDLFAMRNEENLGYLAPIKYNKDGKGYYYEDPEFSIDKLSLNEEDVEAIKFATATLSQFKGISIFKHFDNAIDKLLDRVNISSDMEDGAIDAYVHFDSVPNVEGSEFLPGILNAIKRRRKIRFTYTKYSDNKPNEHILAPYLLKEYKSRWYLIGYSELKSTFLTFGIGRMAEMLELQEAYIVNPSFNPDRFFKHCIGITTGAGEPLDIRLSFKPLTGQYVKSQPLHHSQKIITDNDMELVVELHVMPTVELSMHILAFGKDVKVISPPSVMANIKEVLQETIRTYEA